MTTPAINIDVSTREKFTSQWYYGGVRYPNGDVTATIGTSKETQVRPKSSSTVKIGGLWGLTAWQHKWSRIYPTYKSWQSTSKSDPRSVHVWRGTPYLGSNEIFSGARTVAPFIDGGLFPAQLEFATRTEFLNELAGTKWDVGEMLAEAKHTAEYLQQAASRVHALTRNMAKRAGTSARKVRDVLSDRDVEYLIDQQTGVWTSNPKKRKRKTAAAKRRAYGKHGKRLVENLAGAWLENQFGVQPILRDLASATVNLNDLATKDRKGVAIRLSVTKGVDNEEVYDNTHGSTLRGGAKQDWLVSSVMTIVGDYRLDDAMLRSNRQLGLTSAASMAYAVLRYSWLIDYLVDVGSWIKSLDAPLGLVPLQASISRTQRLKLQLVTPGSKAVSYDNLAPYTIKSVDIGRMTRSIEPLVYPGLPPLGEMLSVPQALNTLAVLTKLFR